MFHRTILSLSYSYLPFINKINRSTKPVLWNGVQIFCSGWNEYFREIIASYFCESRLVLILKPPTRPHSSGNLQLAHTLIWKPSARCMPDLSILLSFCFRIIACLLHRQRRSRVSELAVQEPSSSDSKSDR